MNKNPSYLVAALFIALTAACSKPTDIVLGPEPLKQMSEQGDQFKKLSEEDRVLLASYLGIAQLGKALGGEVKPTTGRTVGEVLTDARAWQAKVKEQAAESQKRQAEAEALKKKALAERKVFAERMASVVTVAVINKRVLPKSYDAGRYSEMLALDYAIENRSDKAIRQIKGRISFFDATGDEIGWLPVNFDRNFPPKNTVKSDFGRGWKLNEFRNGEIEKIANASFDGMKTRFDAEAIAFEDGEVLRVPGSGDLDK